jgi:hypothetical protein
MGAGVADLFRNVGTAVTTVAPAKEATHGVWRHEMQWRRDRRQPSRASTHGLTTPCTRERDMTARRCSAFVRAAHGARAGETQRLEDVS